MTEEDTYISTWILQVLFEVLIKSSESAEWEFLCPDKLLLSDMSIHSKFINQSGAE